MSWRGSLIVAFYGARRARRGRRSETAATRLHAVGQTSWLPEGGHDGRPYDSRLKMKVQSGSLSLADSICYKVLWIS